MPGPQHRIQALPMDIITLIMTAGKSAVELALFVLLPVMVIMLCVMRLLEAFGVLDRLVTLLAPVLKPFGLTGLSVFALLQVNFVSFAAPVATLATMDRRGVSDRHLAATLAMVFAMAQANVTYPLAGLGLSFGTFMLISIIGGLIAAAFTYYLTGRRLSATEQPQDETLHHPVAHDPKGVLAIISSAGNEAFRISTGTIPLVALSLLFVLIIKDVGIIHWLEVVLTPILGWAGINPALILPTLTKYLAGGSALLGVLVDMHNHGQADAHLINTSAGWLVHTLDLPGIAIMMSAGPRVAKIWKPAAVGGLVGILARTLGQAFWG